MSTFNSLANLLAACVQSADNCDALFAAATSPRGRAPRDTLQAMVNIAHNPWQNVADLFTLSQESILYQPALGPGAMPDAWTLAIRYHGDGPEGQRINGPGNIAFDKDGNAWVTNNYRFDLDPAQTVCGSDKVLKLTPTGGSAPGAPYFGGGLYGAGFGITLDPDGNVWVGNFGFQGTGCPLPYRDLSKSVSKFGADGTALSPVEGFTKQGTFDQPQGTVSHRQGNIWVANCSGQTVTLIPGGNPDEMRNINGVGSKPFDIAIDTRGHAWVTVNNAPTGNEQGFPSGVVRELATDGSFVGDPVTGADGIQRPMGIATDSLGNVWVANSGVFNPPCEDTLAGDSTTEDIGDNGEKNDKAAVTLIRPLGKSRRVVTTFGKEDGPRGGLALPWGIAIDGNDNVWVANFAGQRLTQLCGVRPENCPPGKRTGDPISPDTGYSSDALVRNTGVQIDPSGNVC